MTEQILTYLQSVPWYWVLAISLLVTFTENIFPPAPCDTILVFAGTLVGIGVVGYFPLLIVATIGSWIGFILMYWLGKEFGIKLIDSKRFKFINRDAMQKPEAWFQKYGFYIIAANRFLSGTRAVISFFAGLMELSAWRTSVLSAVSALVWNAILIYFGMLFGANWRLADHYIALYSKIIFPIVGLIIILFFIRWLIQKFRPKKVTPVNGIKID